MTCLCCKKEAPTAELTAYRGRCEECFVGRQVADGTLNSSPGLGHLSGVGKFRKGERGQRTMMEYEARSSRY